MQLYHSSHRRGMLRVTSTLVSAAILTLAMMAHLAPAHASQAGSTLETARAGIASDSAVVRSPAGAAAADGFTCRGFLPVKCGYLLSKGPTKTIITAASAGGIVAAVAACNAIPGVSQLACGVIGAVSGVALADLASGYTEGTCLFLTVPLDLVDC